MGSRTTNKDKRLLIEQIANLGATEHAEIFKIIGESVKYTQNSNGIFLNFKDLSDAVVERIKRFVEFCLENKTHLDEYDLKLNERKLNNKFDTPSIAAETSQASLDVFISSSITPDTWVETLKESKQKERIDNVVEVLEGNMQRINKKKTCNTRYSNAKKKYGRKVVVDKRADGETLNVLSPEPYLLAHKRL
jgi:hypothetical protein